MARCLRTFAHGALIVVALHGCGAPPDEESIGDEWPLSAIDVPAPSDQVGEEAGGVEQAADAGSGTQEGGAGTVATEPAPYQSQPYRVPELYRPEMDMEASGPMIHTTPDLPELDEPGSVEPTTDPPPGDDSPVEAREGADDAGEIDAAEVEVNDPQDPEADSVDAVGGASDSATVRFPRPDHVRGLYVNAWNAGSQSRMTELLALAERTEINSFVIDIKDATGYISHPTTVEMAFEVGATEEIRIRDLPGLLARLEEAGVYPIARIVVVKDPLTVAARPDLAIQDTTGATWIDSKELVWINPYATEAWDYHVELAREVAELGFPEIQWDYIRFPDAPESDMARAVFPGGEGVARPDAIRGFLSYAREELSELAVLSTADVFGVTTSFRRDIGIGQLWETFIDVVDVALPMVYPSHYWQGSFGYDTPNAYPFEVVYAALRDGLRRSARVDDAGLTRPWIQDFSLGRPLYGGPEVRAQIQAAYDVGIEEWILWNPSSRYTESAIEPVGGFEEEPLIRVAGLLAPVSRRWEVMDSVAAVAAEADSLPQIDTTALPVDTTGVGQRR